MFAEGTVVGCLLLSVLWLRYKLLYWDHEKPPKNVQILKWSTIGLWVMFPFFFCVFTFPTKNVQVASFDAHDNLLRWTKYTFAYCMDNRCLNIPTTPVVSQNSMVCGNGRKATVSTQISMVNPLKFYQIDISSAQKKLGRMMTVDEIEKFIVRVDDWAYRAMIARKVKDVVLWTKLEAFSLTPIATEQQIRDLKAVIQQEKNNDLAKYGLSARVQEIIVDGGVK